MICNNIRFTTQIFQPHPHPRMMSSAGHLTTPAVSSSSLQQTPALGFGDLCRYFYRALREDFEDYTAHNVMDKDCQEFDYI